MREILFRGKRGNNWLYGNLEIFDNGKIAFINELNGQYKRVEENTIGQCTGLKDKNGTKIFEGDIVKTFENEILYVFFNEKRASFCLSKFIKCKENKFEVYCDMYDYDEKGIEVIGNIHDNPELLEV